MVFHRRHFIFALSLIAASAIAASCHAKKTPADAMAEADRQAIDYRTQSKWTEQSTGVQQQPVLVTQGPTPLVHLFDIGGPVRIIDLTSKSPLASATVSDRTIVRIDDRNGVTVGRQNLLPGPLPPGHSYGIYLDPSTPNTMRQGIGPPGDVPRQ